MADLPTNLPQLEDGQGLNRTQVNELVGALWPGSHYGIDEAASTGLTLVLFEANVNLSGTPTRVGPWSLTLTASTTNYLYRDSSGVAHTTTSIPSGWPGPLTSSAVALYAVVTGTDGPTSIIDYRLSGGTTATGAAGAYGGAVTFEYEFSSTTTDSDPGSGILRLNNAGQNAATMLYADLLDKNGNDITAVLDSLDAAGATINGRLRLVHKTDFTKWLLFAVGVRTTASGYRKLAITLEAASGSAPFTASDRVLFMFNHNGTQGINGANGGAIVIPYTFSTTTTDSDPSSGNLRLSNATQNAATVIRTSTLDSSAGDWTSVLDTLDASTSTIKGQIRLSKVGDPTKFLLFDLTARALGTGSPSAYRNFTVSNTGGSAASPFSNADAILLTFTRNGDKGDNWSAAVNAQVGTTYTLVAGDNGKAVTLNNASAITLTVPASLGANFVCKLTQLGSGQVTVTASGTTVNSYASLVKLAGQYAEATLYAYAADTFVLSGNLSA